MITDSEVTSIRFSSLILKLKGHDLDDFIQNFISYNNVTTKYNEPEHELLKQLSNWTPLEMIKKTFQMSTQHAVTPASSVTEKTYRFHFLRQTLNTENNL